MRVKALVRCLLTIEYEDDNEDIKETVENICMSSIEDILPLETEDSIQRITILESYKV
jgi:hypothetical protein